MRYSGSAFTGLLIALIGLAFLLDNLGLFGYVRLADYFPLIFTFYGVLWLGRCTRPQRAILPVVMIVGGILGTLGNLHILRISVHELWPLILIAVGLSMLARRSGGWGQGGFDPERFGRRRFRFSTDVHVAGANRSASDAPALDENAIFSEIKRIITSQEFTGGQVQATFGAVKIDLRNAGMPPGKSARVDCQASFGGIEFRVPGTWRVIWEGAASFGAFHDKTVPPRPESGAQPPTLVLTGQAAFGGIEVRN
jgi:hypothetical protein